GNHRSFAHRFLLLLSFDARGHVPKWRGMTWLIRKRREYRSPPIGDIVIKPRRQRLPGDPTKGHGLGIEINRDRSRRQCHEDRLALRTQRHSQSVLAVTLHVNQQLKRKTKGLVRLNNRGLQLKG